MQVFKTGVSQISREVLNVKFYKAVFNQVSPKVKAITVANHISHKQCNEPIRTQNIYMFPVPVLSANHSLSAYEVKNNCHPVERLFRVKNGVYLFVISFVLEIFIFFVLCK